jgi:hypothetical protein
MSRAALWTPGSPQTGSLAARRVAGALRSVGPPLLFGLRLWASVCLVSVIVLLLCVLSIDIHPMTGFRGRETSGVLLRAYF